MTSKINTTPRKRTVSEAIGQNESYFHDHPILCGPAVEADITPSSSSFGIRKRLAASSRKSDEETIETITSSKNNNSSRKSDDDIAARPTPMTSSPSSRRRSSVVPLSMQLLRPLWSISCCPNCGPNNRLNAFSSADARRGYNPGGFWMNGGGGGIHHRYCSSVGIVSEDGAGAASSREEQAKRDASLRTLVSMASFDNHSPAVSRRDDSLVAEANDVDDNAHGKTTSTGRSVPNLGEDNSFPSSKEHSPNSSITSSTPSNSSINTLRNQRRLVNAIPATPTSASLTADHPLAIPSPPRPTSPPIERILAEYAQLTQIYGCRLNPGVLTSLRYRLPTLRVSGNFFDADMLALAEMLLKYGNGELAFVERLDFRVAAREGKAEGGGKRGMRSHGAYALSRVLMTAENVREVYLSGNRIGPFGAKAVFRAVGANGRGGLRGLWMRGCRIGEVGALSFVEEVLAVSGRSEGGGACGGASKLREVDLSCNRIGFRGCMEIEKILKKREDAVIVEGSSELFGGRKSIEEITSRRLRVDLEGNLVFQEVMNCVTHGLGVLLATLGTYLLTKRVQNSPPHYSISCSFYSASLIALYASSTLYHSFFALKHTKFIFKAFDRCAIFTLIAGSYTPFLTIALHHEPLWSMHLLGFIWMCAICGIVVEATMMHWKHKSKFSLAMYLGMGWSCVVCLPDLVEVIPWEALGLLIAGGVAYTAGGE